MSKKVIFLFIQIILIATILGCANTNMSEKSTIDLDKNHLVNEATTIILGEVISSEVNKDFIGFSVTDYKIRVDKAFKGNPKSEIVVRTSGGKNDKMDYIPDDDIVKFKNGEKVVLFLTDDIDVRPDRDDFDYFVVGDYQGKFKEVNGVLKNEKFTFDVSTFEEELKQIEEENRASSLKKIKAEPGNDI